MCKTKLVEKLIVPLRNKSSNSLFHIEIVLDRDMFAIIV